MFISKMVRSSMTLPCPFQRIARVVPVLNGRDSDGKRKYLGPEATKIHRYLLVLCAAKSESMYRLAEKGVKEIDNSFYFTMYKLWQIANSFKDAPPYHLPITYDRTKVAGKIYDIMSKKGLVTIKKIDGDSYVTTTKKGDDESEGLLDDLGEYFDNDSGDRFVSKGGGYDPELQKEEKQRLAERITKINLPFEDELKTIEDDSQGDGDDESQTE
jgi:hypothetical protein